MTRVLAESAMQDMRGLTRTNYFSAEIILASLRVRVNMRVNIRVHESAYHFFTSQYVIRCEYTTKKSTRRVPASTKHVPASTKLGLVRATKRCVSCKLYCISMDVHVRSHS